MSNIIRFLEKLGSEAQWGDVTTDNLELALVDAQVENTLHSAVLNKDALQLQMLMQQKTHICMVEPAEEEEEEESGDEPVEKDMKRSSSWSPALEA
jgi:hypothetical protein